MKYFNQGRLKAKQIEKNLKSIKTAFKVESSFGQMDLVSAKKLEDGFNKGKLLAGTITQFISAEGQVPL